MRNHVTPANRQRQNVSMPLKVSLIYLLISSLWISLSDQLLAAIFPSLELYQQAQTYKGWGFVIVTTLALFFVLFAEERKLRNVQKTLEQERVELLDTIAQLEEANQEIKELARRCSTIEESERRRLASELHDRLGQTLTAININLKILEGSLPQEAFEAAVERINEIHALVNEAVSQMRDVIAELHPPILDDFGLGEALKWLGERFRTRFQMPLTVDVDQPAERLPETVEMAFYRVAQSALDNVLRHAQASAVRLSLHYSPEKVELLIEDNGRGFDPELVLKSKGYPTWGVKIMRERMLAVGGHLSIDTEPGKGTRIIASWEAGEAE